jgi:hypothetical protein
VIGWIRHRVLGRPGQRTFAGLAEAALREVGVPGTFRFDEDGFVLVREGPKTTQWILHNAYRAYLEAPRSEQGGVLRRYASAFLVVMPETFEEARPHLVPQVRAERSFGLVDLRNAIDGDRGSALVHTPVAEGIAAALALDGETTIQTLRQDVLEGWGTRFEEASAVALRALRERSQEAFRPMGRGVYLAPLDDSNSASRILLPELFYRFPLRGNPVAMLPTRDVLLVTGSEDPEGLCAMVEAASKFQGQSYPLSASAFVLADDRERLRLDPGHRAAAGLGSGERAEVLRDYAEQKELLERLHARRGEDLHVASVFEVRDSQG